jgi:tetratricopeptide (TPR) repeat protein
MPSCLRDIRKRSRVALPLTAVAIGLVSFACAADPPSNLPPSASDLILLKSARLCDKKAAFLRGREAALLRREVWGSGEEVRIAASHSESRAEESFFFDEDGLLVGALFTFPIGLNLKPYPVLRETLSQLKPTLEFYVNVAQVGSRTDLDTSALYMTGDEKSTTQYIVLGGADVPSLLLASFSVDPYATLLSPRRKEFLARVGGTDKSKSSLRTDSKGDEDKELFPALQEFARGEAAHLAYCGTRNDDIAVVAYQKAIKHGFSNKVQLAEAYHKLGLALKGKGELEEARDAIQQSLVIQPNRPEVLNNLGDVYKQLGDQEKALKAFEKAVSLRPNYPLARFNLAEAYEAVNPKLAISEYETYLALVEGIPEEADRAALARRRVKALTR